jgi:uncharacterized caspase-like protein
VSGGILDWARAFRQNCLVFVKQYMAGRDVVIRAALILLMLVATPFGAFAQGAATAAGAAPTERRVALVIGNGNYQHIGQLSNPRNDAQLMANALRTAGFELIGGEALVDGDRGRMVAAVRQFGQALGSDAVAIFYYAGHGVEVRGNNYLIPVEANPRRELDVELEMFDAGIVLRQMEGAGARLSIMILDACRNNPLAGRGLRSGSAGLQPMRAARGTIISYAAQPGAPALDGDDANSPYTQALADAIRRPGLNVLDVFNEVGLAVERRTGGMQVPWVSSSPIEGRFFFVPGSGPSETQGPQQSAALTPQAMEAQQDFTFWSSIANATTAQPFRDYLQAFPNGRFAALARTRIDTLSTRRPEESETALAEPMRTRIIQGLRMLGHLREAPGAEFTPAVRVAIRAFQIFEGAEDSGQLTEAQRNQIFAYVERLTYLLDAPERSPLRRAASSVADGEARFRLGYQHESGQGAARNDAEALYWYRQAARERSAEAYNNLGLRYARGQGVTANLSDATLLWRVGAALGEATSAFNLGAQAERGLGVPRDTNVARRWYQIAERLGHSGAQAAIRQLTSPR